MCYLEQRTGMFVYSDLLSTRTERIAAALGLERGTVRPQAAGFVAAGGADARR